MFTDLELQNLNSADEAGPDLFLVIVISVLAKGKC